MQRFAAVAPEVIKTKPRTNIAKPQPMLRKGYSIMAWGDNIRPLGIKADWSYKTRKGNAKPSDCRTV